MQQSDTLEPEMLRSSEGAQPERRTRITTRVDRAENQVVKVARDEDRARLRREAEVLRAVGGSDVVRVVELRDGPESTELVLRDTGGTSLAAVLRDPTTSPSRSLTLLARTCDAVARLHQSGWAHGRIEADHVLLTARGRIRLCSLSAAMPLDIDPSVGRADRIALLRMVDDWTHASADSGRRMSVSRRIRSRVLERRTRRLPDDPDPRLLGRILRRTAGPDRAPAAPRRPHRRRLVASALGVVAVAAVGWSLLTSAGDQLPNAAVSTSTTRATTAPPSQSSTTQAATSMPEPVQAPTSAPSIDCPVVDQSTPDPDGDGCGDDVEIDGNVVIVGDRRYRLGSEGDIVSVGDWDCDGTATPAVLRPATGSVHVFDAWATDGEPTTATEWDDVTGAVTFAPSGADCGPPRIVTFSGATVTAGEAGTP